MRGRPTSLSSSCFDLATWLPHLVRATCERIMRLAASMDDDSNSWDPFPFEDYMKKAKMTHDKCLQGDLNQAFGRRLRFCLVSCRWSKKGFSQRYDGLKLRLLKRSAQILARPPDSPRRA
ncbi:hypothetical protein BOTBODRAFT_66162 [Botryobasidium botryosum FD-172 SS1]|uniref:Uncharacterized protein n=1 Tax=Botryobasidium botryosum (strain FD-172 SS1) TaxID=930990 RepID=A0A067MIM0_BOTB1|nr:hypothetical protein BOTBODRAFT_66162 [Botryobasidium botryosum FD-172 SS1]